MVEYMLSACNTVVVFVISTIDLIKTRNLIPDSITFYIIVLAVLAALLVFMVYLRLKHKKQNVSQNKYLQQRFESVMKTY